MRLHMGLMLVLMACGGVKRVVDGPESCGVAAQNADAFNGGSRGNLFMFDRWHWGLGLEQRATRVSAGDVPLTRDIPVSIGNQFQTLAICLSQY